MAIFTDYRKHKFSLELEDGVVEIECRFPLIDPDDEDSDLHRLLAAPQGDEDEAKIAAAKAEELTQKVIDSIHSWSNFTYPDGTPVEVNDKTRRVVFFNLFDYELQRKLVRLYIGITAKN